MRSPPSLLRMIRVVGNDISYSFTFGRHKDQIPIIIRSPHRIRANMDMGPVISFTDFSAITSNMQTTGYYRRFTLLLIIQQVTQEMQNQYLFCNLLRSNRLCKVSTTSKINVSWDGVESYFI